MTRAWRSTAQSIPRANTAAFVERLRSKIFPTISVVRATAAGAIVVSARESGGVVWLPGSIQGVASVVSDSNLEREEMEVDERDFIAAPYPRPIPGVPRERNLSGVSFAVANVSGFLARLIQGRDDLQRLDDVRHVLLPV